MKSMLEFQESMKEVKALLLDRWELFEIVCWFVPNPRSGLGQAKKRQKKKRMRMMLKKKTTKKKGKVDCRNQDVDREF